MPGAEIICLGEHVDYWNQLGWKDVFSSAEFTQRQQKYSQALGLETVYTPQMVVDGRMEFNGGNSVKAASAIAQAVRSAKATVQIARNGGHLQVHVENVPGCEAADVLLAITESDLASNVSRGENAGRVMKHAGVVRRLVVLGAVKAASFSAEPVIPVDRNWKSENLRAVVFIQERSSRRILGAASTSLGATQSTRE